MPQMTTLGFFVSLWDSVQEFVFDACVCKECSPSVSVARMICGSGFDDYFSYVKYDSSNNIQEIISLVSILIFNDAAICGGRMGSKVLVRDLSEMWKYTKSKYAMMFAYLFYVLEVYVHLVTDEGPYKPL